MKVIPVVRVFVVHPHKVLLEAIDLRLATDDPVIMHHHTVAAAFTRREDAVSFLEVVHAAHVPVAISAYYLQQLWLILTNFYGRPM